MSLGGLGLRIPPAGLLSNQSGAGGTHGGHVAVARESHAVGAVGGVSAAVGVQERGGDLIVRDAGDDFIHEGATLQEFQPFLPGRRGPPAQGTCGREGGGEGPRR